MPGVCTAGHVGTLAADLRASDMARPHGLLAGPCPRRLLSARAGQPQPTVELAPPLLVLRSRRVLRRERLLLGLPRTLVRPHPLVEPGAPLRPRLPVQPTRTRPDEARAVPTVVGARRREPRQIGRAPCRETRG